MFKLKNNKVRKTKNNIIIPFSTVHIGYRISSKIKILIYFYYKIKIFELINFQNKKFDLFITNLATPDSKKYHLFLCLIHLL